METETWSLREKEILEKVTEVLRDHFAPSQIILFGSRGKGGYHRGSDFDFAVDEARPEVTEEREIFEEIEKVAGLYDVDIIYLKEIEPAFKEIILKTGKVVYERRS